MSEKGHSVGITSCARAATSQDHAILSVISMFLYNSKTAGTQDALFAVSEEWIIEDGRLYLLRVLCAHRMPFKGQLGVGFLEEQEIIVITISSYFGSRIIYYSTLNINNIHIKISIYTIYTIYQQFISNLCNKLLKKHFNSPTSMSILIINTSSIYHTT